MIHSEPKTSSMTISRPNAKRHQVVDIIAARGHVKEEDQVYAHLCDRQNGESDGDARGEWH